MMEQLLANTAVSMLVFVRMTGMIGMNPLLARRNMPGMMRAGLIFALTLLITPGIDPAPYAHLDTMGLIGAMLLELVVGFACGFVFEIFYFMLYFTGDLMDFQFGLSMAKAFDPGTRIQASVSGNLLTLMFVLFLLATNSHLLLIRVFADTFRMIPPGAVVLSPEVAGAVFDIFASVFSLGVRLAIPFIAAEFVLEISMGILMKLIPQIHVFVINIQFKVLLGFFMLLAFAMPISSFMDNYITYLFDSLEKVIVALS